MRRTLLEIVAAVALTIAAAVTSVSGANASDLMVMKAFARASTTPTAATGAAYVSLMNHGKEGDSLVSVSTPAAAIGMSVVTAIHGPWTLAPARRRRR